MHRTLSVLTCLSHGPRTGLFPFVIRLPVAGPRHAEGSPAHLAQTGRGNPTPRRSLPAGERVVRGAAGLNAARQPAPCAGVQRPGAGLAAGRRARGTCRVGCSPPRGGSPRPRQRGRRRPGPGAGRLAAAGARAPRPVSSSPALSRPSPWRRAGPAWRSAGGARGGSHLARRPPAGRRPGAGRTPQSRCWVKLAECTRVLPCPPPWCLVAPGAR